MAYKVPRNMAHLALVDVAVLGKGAFYKRKQKPVDHSKPKEKKAWPKLVALSV